VLNDYLVVKAAGSEELVFLVEVNIETFLLVGNERVNLEGCVVVGGLDVAVVVAYQKFLLSVVQLDEGEIAVALGEVNEDLFLLSRDAVNQTNVLLGGNNHVIVH